MRRTTSYPTHIKGKVVAVNSCSSPRNATDKAELVQFPIPFVTVGSEDPREGAPRVLKRQNTPREWIKMPLNLARVPYKWKTQMLVEYRTRTGCDVGPTLPKPSSPTKSREAGF